jgi:Ser/Thr protein kinase RdoA (MazF antagonist)
MSSNNPGRFQEAVEITSRFASNGEPIAVEPLGEGLINHTFAVTFGTNRGVLQRINPLVFPHPERIMENLSLLSAHLSAAPPTGLRVPGLLPAPDGRKWMRGRDGALWRLMEMVESAHPLERIETDDQAAEVGRALGSFHRSVANLSPGDLAVTLPGFHVTPEYVSGFEQVLRARRGSRHGPAIDEAVAFVADRRDSVGVLEAARRSGQVPERVIHGDPKLDNILFDGDRRQAVAIIDLDTVQPGLVQHDIGDCLRSCCNRSGEVSGSSAPVTFDLTLCRQLLEAYGETTGKLLRPEEINLIFDAIRIIPFELGVRFLTDHLVGNRWFRTTEPNGNLKKAAVQFALAEDIERKEAEIRAIVKDCFGGYRPAKATGGKSGWKTGVSRRGI